MRRSRRGGKGRKGKRRWVQAARESMIERGTVGSYGHHSARQQKRDIAKGGRIGKKALFASNMRKAAAKRKRRHHSSRS